MQTYDHQMIANEEIEAQAEAVLNRVPPWIWDGTSLPVPVEDIADSYFGLLVRDADDLRAVAAAPRQADDQPLSGLLLPAKGEIWVNAAEGHQWPGRRRFTICHEIGHWCMHRDEDQPVFCRWSTVEPADPRARTRGEVPPAEEEAQIFAAAMLMPAQLLRREYERDRDFGRLCNCFRTSGAAMGRRLHAVI